MTITVKEGTKTYILPLELGDTIYDTLVKQHISGLHAPCGGKKACKKCEVTVFRDGSAQSCLACMTQVEEGMVVALPDRKRVDFAASCFLPLFPPTGENTGFAAAFDVGTSSIILHIMDLQTGASVASLGRQNIQNIYGKNVLSRLQACADGRFEELHSLLKTQLNAMLRKACAKAGISLSDISYGAVTGNTVMEHFVAGLNPAEKGIAPFVPLSLFGKEYAAEEIGLSLSCNLFLCPAVSEYMGGDAVTGILCGGMADSEKPVLLLDMGANGDMVLGCGDRLVACAADAASAVSTSLMAHGMLAAQGAISAVRCEGERLEYDVIGGGKPLGICGSGFVDALAILSRLGILDETGHIQPEEAPQWLESHFITVDGRPAFRLTEDPCIAVTERDVSSFQLGKAAIYAGIQVLCKELGIRSGDISVCLLGGCLGTFIHPENAAEIGLIPAELLKKGRVMGNAAIGGAQSAAISSAARESLKRIAGSVRYLSLSNHPHFNNAYIDGMMFDN